MENPNATNQFQPSQAPEKTPFYQTTWFILLMMFCCCFPVGLFLMWKYKKFHIAVRITLTTLLVLIFLGSMIGAIIDVVGTSSKRVSASNNTEYSQESYSDALFETTAEIPYGTEEATTADTTISETAAVATEAITEAAAEDIMEVTPGELLDAYEANAVNADALYKDQELRFTGTISDIGKDFSDKVYVNFQGSEDFSVTTVQCYFSDSAEIEKVSSLSKGDTITVVGICGGKFANVFFNDCIIE